MSDNENIVYVVDDDDAVRDSIALLLESVGMNVRAHSSAVEFLEQFDAQKAGCIVADIRMPKMSGLELQERLKSDNVVQPMILISGHGDIPMAVQAVKDGALDFIQKPFRDQELLDRINEALELNKEKRYVQGAIGELKGRYESLSDREKEVMHMVVEGRANKVIALDLHLSQRTVEIHRSRVMDKMKARSLADLVKMAVSIGETATNSTMPEAAM